MITQFDLRRRHLVTRLASLSRFLPLQAVVPRFLFRVDVQLRIVQRLLAVVPLTALLRVASGNRVCIPHIAFPSWFWV